LKPASAESGGFSEEHPRLMIVHQTAMKSAAATPARLAPFILFFHPQIAFIAC